MCRVEFGISSLEDLGHLLKAWGKHLAAEGQPARDIHVDVMLEDRVPGEVIPGLFSMCRVEPECF